MKLDLPKKYEFNLQIGDLQNTRTVLPARLIHLSYHNDNDQSDPIASSHDKFEFNRN